MHYGFFGLVRPPFETNKHTNVFFEGGGRRETLESLLFALDHGSVTALIGEPGSGKSVIVGQLKERLTPGSQVFHAELTCTSLLTQLKSGVSLLGNFTEQNTIDDCLADIQTITKSENNKEKAILLILEDFENETSATWSKITELVKVSQRCLIRLKILFVGTKKIIDKIPSHRKSNNTSIDYNFVLRSLNESSSSEYIKHRLVLAGGDARKLFSDQALEKIIKISEGYPKKIDEICRKSLENAFKIREKTVKPSHIPTEIENQNTNSIQFFLSSNQKIMKLDRESYIATSFIGLVFISVGVYALVDNIANNITKVRDTKIELLSDPEKMALSNKNTENETYVASSSNEIDIPADEIEGSLDATEQEEPPAIPAADILNARLLATANFLSNTNGSEFSVQLLGGTDKQILRQQIIELSGLIDINQIFAFRTLAKDKPYITILYGKFATLQSAQKAISELPAKLKSNRPYLRTTKGIKAEIETNLEVLKTID